MIRLIAILIIELVILSSCITKHGYVPVVHSNIQSVWMTDTVLVTVRDRQFVNRYMVGDTVHEERICTLYVDRWHKSTIRDTLRDSIPIIVPVEREPPNADGGIPWHRKIAVILFVSFIIILILRYVK